MSDIISCLFWLLWKRPGTTLYRYQHSLTDFRCGFLLLVDAKDWKTVLTVRIPVVTVLNAKISKKSTRLHPLKDKVWKLQPEIGALWIKFSIYFFVYYFSHISLCMKNVRHHSKHERTYERHMHVYIREERCVRIFWI